MDSHQLMDAIKVVENCASDSLRVAQIRQYYRDEAFRLVLRYGMDPTIRFVVGAPEREPKIGTCFFNIELSVMPGGLLHWLTQETTPIVFAERYLNDVNTALTPRSGELLRRIIRKRLGKGFNRKNLAEAVPEMDFRRRKATSPAMAA